MDTGATDHLTHDMERLHVHEPYHGRDQVQVANGAGLSVLHIGHSRLAGPMHSLDLRNILHVPNISKNLLFVHRIVSDNDVFIEFHRDFFCVKDKATKTIFLQGRSQGVCILFLFIGRLLGMQQPALSSPLGNGINGLVILQIMQFKVLSRIILYRVLLILSHQCVMRVSVLRVISYLILFHIVFPLSLSNLFIPMFGVLLCPLLVDTNIILVLLMTIADTAGFILLNTNRMLRKFFISFKSMLSASLTLRFVQCSPIGVVSIIASMPISVARAYSIEYPARTHLNKMVLLNANTDILLRHD